SRTPRPGELTSFVGRLEDGMAEILDVADWISGFDVPAFPRPAELVSLVHPHEYPVNEGTVATTAGREFDAAAFEDNVQEFQVEHSNALHAKLIGRGAYVVGPLSRINLNWDRLT